MSRVRLAILAVAKRANFNIVYPQVRGVADALYRSSVEPCSIRLCGKLGGTATWDPLEVALAEAHSRGIQLHSWLNAFTGWTPTSASTCQALAESDPGNPRHVLLAHPEWRVVNDAGVTHPCPNTEESVWLSPGIPACGRTSRASRPASRATTTWTAFTSTSSGIRD